MRRGPEDAVAVRWLTERGVWLPGKSHAENMERCAKFREKVGGRIGTDTGKQWAKNIVDRYQSGERVPMQFVRLAMEALGRGDVPLVRTPEKPVPRPDAKERAAGDVEVSF